ETRCSGRECVSVLSSQNQFTTETQGHRAERLGAKVGRNLLTMQDQCTSFPVSLCPCGENVQFARCSVFPASNWMACGISSITACNESAAPAGLPGRFSTTDVPQTPHTPRL